MSQETVDGSRHIYLDQGTVLKQLLSSFDGKRNQLKNSPMPTKQLLHLDIAPIGENEAAHYRHFVGTLRATRFDILLAVSRLSSKMSTPDVDAWQSLVHLRGYLTDTTAFRIGGEVECQEDVFEFYVDSDHAEDRLRGSRSQTECLFFLHSFLVDWCSRKQPDSSVSPAEADPMGCRGHGDVS